ncbi:MAG: tRNA (N(6)-L-threonylcarbamoyladenosine(37)-C(2))-methylthiotransferase MtaB, partial [Lachnospiraceae bacterium]|nr:tRNA (N(6)-L-threonylcarbamoyladenosine(37)-C(2))-methylthiotransferase MtaB [Lachnospiraceae bacterium]
ADRMAGQLPDRVKAARSAVLIKLGAENKEKYINSFRDGTVCELLTEEETVINGRAYLTGFTREYIRCAVPQREGLHPNQTVYGTIGEALDNDTVLLNENPVKG